MRAESLRLQHVRNHRERVLPELAPRINVFSGPNGVGKTSILEALALATVTKSFTTSNDAVLITNGETDLDVDARFRSDLDVPHHVSIELLLGPPLRKTLKVNNERLRTASLLIGRAPVVVLTPDDKVITNGAPAERRRFLNIVLSQASTAYLNHEMEFRRALKQRNTILAESKLHRQSPASVQALIEPWTVMVIHHGARIIERRARFAKEFKPYLLESYQLLSESREEPDLSYQPSGMETTVERVEDAELLLREQWKTVTTDEFRRGTTLFGPHRDELLLFINPGCEARDHASQGQHKTLLVAMKLAEFRYLAEASGETPILLLDDVFSELDAMRAARLLQLVQEPGFGQTFITSTDKTLFERTFDLTGIEHRLFQLESSTITSLA